MTPAEDQAIRANLIAVFEWTVIPVCLVSSIVQLWLLSRTGAFTRVRQYVAAIAVSPMLMIPLTIAFAWLEGSGVVRGMYAPLRLLPSDLRFTYGFAYIIYAPAIAAAVVAYTFVGRIALKRARRASAPDLREST